MIIPALAREERAFFSLVVLTADITIEGKETKDASDNEEGRRRLHSIVKNLEKIREGEVE